MAEHSRRSSKERQTELTDAALHIIATRGIAALNTRTLAEEVGLSTGAIFRHFASLDALLDAVVTRVESVLEATYPPRDLPAGERLERFVEARSTSVGNQVGMLRLVISEQFLLALPEGGSERLARCVQRTREFVLHCLRQGQATGEFRTDIDASALAVVVMGTVQMLAVETSRPRHLPAEAGHVRAGLLALLQPLTRDRQNRRRKST
jgi:AcrR family transcriptional regulator